MEYSKEQLAAAFSAESDSLTWGELIAKLEKPKPVFKVGEVVETRSDDTCFVIAKRYKHKVVSLHLTPEEAPGILAELDEYVKSCRLKTS